MKRGLCVIVLAALLLCTASTACRAPAQSLSSEGLYLRSDSAAADLIILDGEPFEMIPDADAHDSIFSQLSDGDRIRISHSAVAERYPGLIQVYSCELVESGERSDIPDSVIHQLESLGWL